MEANVSGKTVSFGLRWFSKTSKNKLDVDDLKQKYAANRILIVESKTRASIGLVQNSPANSKQTVVGAAAIARMMPNGVAVVRLGDAEIPEMDTVKWWTVVCRNGVPEMDIISDDVEESLRILTKRLSDPVSKILHGVRFGFESNAHESVEHAIQDIKRVTGSDVESTEFSWVRFCDRLSALRGGDLRTRLAKPSLFQTVFTVEGIKDFFLDLDREKKIVIAAVVLALIFLVRQAWVFFSSQEEVYVPRPVAVAPPIEKKVDNVVDQATQYISSTLRDHLVGVGGGWVDTAVTWYHSLPDLTHGYKKSKLECSVASGECTVIYLGSSYSDFSEGLADIERLFQSITFVSDGSKIVGKQPIDKESVVVPDGVIRVADLPAFNRGRTLIESILPVSKARPGLSMSVESAQTIQILPIDVPITIPGDMLSKFVVVGWNASGEYLHQLPVALAAVDLPYTPVRYLSVDQGSFTIKGGHLTQSENMESKQ